MSKETSLRSLTVRLEPDESAMLELVAKQRTTSPEQIARSWLLSGLEICGLSPVPDETSSSMARPQRAGTADELGELYSVLRQQDERLKAIELMLARSDRRRSESISSNRRDQAGNSGGDANRASRSDPKPRARARRDRSRNGGASLHNEIAAVLKEAGKPMSASEIADAIRIRGRYEAPRSGSPISGAMVSSRVSNPQYRELFRRKDRKIALTG